jgi:hypothetical protein
LFGLDAELLGPSEVAVVALVVLVTTRVQRDELEWQLFTYFTKGRDYVVIWLQAPARRVHVPSAGHSSRIWSIHKGQKQEKDMRP